MKETKYVAFSTQKGGAGKTTLTVLVASYLHYVKGYDVAVIDCDFPQYSIHRNLFCIYRHYTNNTPVWDKFSMQTTPIALSSPYRQVALLVYFHKSNMQ